MTEAHPPGVAVERRLTDGRPTCPCLRWHRPVPVEEEGHHPIPVGAPFFGPPDQELLFLCPTEHANVHACIRLHLKVRKQGRTPTSAELWPFRRYTRNLALLAMHGLDPNADLSAE